MDGSGEAPTVAQIDRLLRHDGWLRSLVAQLVSDPGTADDVVQQTWLAALRRPPTGSPRAFLNRVARNLAVGNWRAERRRRQHEQRAAGDEQVSTSTADALARVEMQELVARAVAGLPEPDRSVVLLRHVQGLAPREIAAELGVPATTIRKRCERGLKRLRARMAAELGPEWRAHPGIAALVLPAVGALRDGVGAAASGVTVGGVARVPLILTGLLMNPIRWTALAAVVLLGVTVYLTWRASTEDPSPARTAEVSPLVAGDALADDDDAPSVADVSRAQPGRRTVEATSQNLEEPRVAAPRRTTIAVHLPDGTPVANCRVALAPGSQPPRPNTSVLTLESDLVELGRSGPDGTLVVDVPEASGHLSAIHPGYMMLHTTAFGGGRDAAADRVYRVVLARGVTVEGEVVSADGRPLADVSIRRDQVDLDHFPFPLEHSFRVLDWGAQTDAAGGFHLTDQPANLLDLRFDAGPAFTTEVHRVGDRDEHIQVVLRPTGVAERVLTGLVTGPDGAPLAGATVMLVGEAATKTDSTGHYELGFGATRLDSVATLYAAWPGLRPAVLDDVAARLSDGAPRIDLALTERALTLRGLLLHADGTPIGPGVHVYPWAEPTLDWSVTPDELAADPDAPQLHLGGPALRVFGDTDAEGRFTIEGLGDHDYRLRIYDPSDLLTWTSGPVRPGPAVNEIRLPPGSRRARVAGRVVTRDGQPVAGAAIGQSAMVWSANGGTNWQGRALGSTDADGRFAFDDLPGLELKLTVSGENIVGMDRSIAPDEPATDLEIVVARRCFVRAALGATSPAAHFTILDAEGRTLTLTFKRSGTSSSRTTQRVEAGASRIVAVSEDAATAVLFDAEGEELARFPVRLTPGEVFEIRR